MKKLAILLLLTLPACTSAQSNSGVQLRIVSLEGLELNALQVYQADQVERRYKDRLKAAMRIIDTNRKEAYLQIALAVLNANQQYLGILNYEQLTIWRKHPPFEDKQEFHLNKGGRARTIALAVR